VLFLKVEQARDFFGVFRCNCGVKNQKCQKFFQKKKKTLPKGIDKRQKWVYNILIKSKTAKNILRGFTKL
jgi:hypothetical protein